MPAADDGIAARVRFFRLIIGSSKVL